MTGSPRDRGSKARTGFAGAPSRQAHMRVRLSRRVQRLAPPTDAINERKPRERIGGDGRTIEVRGADAAIFHAAFPEPAQPFQNGGARQAALAIAGMRADRFETADTTFVVAPADQICHEFTVRGLD